LKDRAGYVTGGTGPVVNCFLCSCELVFMGAAHEKIHEIIPVKMLGKEMKLFRLEFHGLQILDAN